MRLTEDLAPFASVELREPGVGMRRGMHLGQIDAVRQRQRVRLRYRSWQQAESRREVDPYGVVYYGGRWFLSGYCHLRHDLRTFRLDRVEAVELCAKGFTRPAEFDALAHVVESLATAPGTWTVEVVLRLTLAQARERIAPEMATLTELPEGDVKRASYVAFVPLVRLPDVHNQRARRLPAARLVGADFGDLRTVKEASE